MSWRTFLNLASGVLVGIGVCLLWLQFRFIPQQSNDAAAAMECQVRIRALTHTIGEIMAEVDEYQRPERVAAGNHKIKNRTIR